MDQTADQPNQNTYAIQPNTRSIHYLWNNKRWLIVAALAGTTIILLICVLVGYLIFDGVAKSSANAVKPSPTASSAPQATHDAKDDKFFASQPLTTVYYSFAQTSNSKNMFQSTPTDTENRLLDIGFPDKFDFNTSPNGKWLLRWNKDEIQKAAASTPHSLSRLFKLDKNSSRIGSVVWQADSSTIAVSVTTPKTSSTKSIIQTTVYIVPLLTMQPVVILETSSDVMYDLVAYPNDTQLYFLENQQGVKNNLTRYNPQSKQIEHQYTNLNQDNLLTRLQYTQDMTRGYVYNQTQVIEYDLSSMAETNVHQINRHCNVGNDNNNHITGISVAPSGNYMLIHEKFEPCRSQTNEEKKTVQPSSRSLMYQLKDKKIVQQVNNLDIPQIERSSWSPSENYTWLTIDSQHSYTIARETLALHSIPKTNRQNLTKERVFSIGWLAP